MRRQQIWGRLVALLLLLPAAGCQADSAQRIEYARQGVTWLRQTSANLDGQIDAVRTALAETRRQLDDPNLTGELAEQLRATVVKFSTELTRLQEQKIQVDATLVKLQGIVDAGADPNADFSDELRILGESLIAGSDLAGGDLAVWLKIAGGALVTLSTLLAAFFKRQQVTTHTALAQVVSAGESFKALRADAATTEAWKARQKATQTPQTAGLVAQIRAELARKGGADGTA